MFKNIIQALLIAATSTLCAQENTTYNGNRPDAHAPIGVMGDHTHGKGEFMISYRYMYMNMGELKRGSDDVAYSNALRPQGDYMVTPLRMPMQMHMLGAMYAPSDRLTLMVMANYLKNEMPHLTAMGINFKTESEGWGDTQVGVLYKFLDKNKQRMHAQVGVSLPTGSIDKEGVTPASSGENVILPYPMQLGTGTYDGVLGVTYLAQGKKISFGAQGRADIRFGTNDNNYTLGNSYMVQSWTSYAASNVVSFSARVQGKYIDGIDGANPALNPMMVITADTANSGGKYLNAAVGVNFFVPKGALKDLRFAVELGHPLYQELEGVQLKTNETFTAGVQYAF